MIKTEPIDIRRFSEGELESMMKEAGEKAFRGRQIYEWLWKKGAEDFASMTNLSKELRAYLEEHFQIRPIALDKKQKSLDGTIKSRFRLHDGHLIESVLIPVPDENRFTVCVSSQVGCSLNCSFCATGKMELMRNLDAGEIVDQVRLVNAQCLEAYNHPLTNIVYMGMGEPLLTHRPVLQSIELITSEKGMGWSPKRITVSTVGIAKMIHKLANEEVKFNLALSLHAADDTKRSEIMPINETNNLAVLMDALKAFSLKTRGRISYEYIAFRDFNDSLADADNLARLCRNFPVRVNIIEYNPVEGVTLEKTEEDQLDRFACHLRNQGIMVTVRRSRGKDIDAACGQLANREE